MSRFSSSRFNPVVGFLGSATDRPDDPQERVAVSIPSWVFWVLRPDGALNDFAVRVVSIPSWVFWVLRQVKTQVMLRLRESFNPVVGFLGSATGGEYRATGLIMLSLVAKQWLCFVDPCCTDT